MLLVIRQERLKRGWTCEYISKQIGVCAETVRLIETGRRKPSYDVLVKLLELFEYNDPRQLFAPVDED